MTEKIQQNEEDAIEDESLINKTNKTPNFIRDAQNEEIIRNNARLENGNSRENACWFLHWAAITADLPLFAAGIGMSWTSPVFPKFQFLEENPFGRPVTTAEFAWIAAFTPLGSAIGPLAAGYCADKLGRKKALLFLTLPMVIGFFILAGADQIMLYYLARFLIGLGTGSAFAVVPMYVSEIAQAHNRGKYGSAMGVLITLGIIFPFSVGPHLSIPVYSVCCAVPLILFIFIFSLFMPESPYYLIKLGEFDKADQALRKLRRNDADIRMELAQIKEGVEEEKSNTAGVKDLFISTAGRKAMIISVGLVVLQQLAGINPLLSFMKTIYEAAGSTIPPNICTIITGSVQVISNTCCIFMVEKVGRKLLLQICCVFCFLSMLILGVYFYLKNNAYNVEPVFWLPITCLIVYMLVFSFGLGPLPWAVMGEILPSNIKGIAAAFTSTISFIASCLVTFLFPVLNDILGMSGGFWFFSFFCFIGYFFVHFCVFETKGKSLAEIQRILQLRT